MTHRLLALIRGGGDLLVAPGLVLLAPELQNGVEQLPALGQPVGHAGSGLVQEEQVQLGAQNAVVALLGLLQQAQMLLHLGLGGEGNDLDALEAFAVGIAMPINGADGVDLKIPAQKLTGVGNVGAGAQILIVGAGIIDGDGLPLGNFVDKLQFVRLVGKLGLRLLALENLLHALLNLGEILGGQVDGNVKIEEEAVILGGAGGQLGAGVELADGLGKNMRQGMAGNFNAILHSNSLHSLIFADTGGYPQNASSYPFSRQNSRLAGKIDVFFVGRSGGEGIRKIPAGQGSTRDPGGGGQRCAPVTHKNRMASMISFGRAWWPTL